MADVPAGWTASMRDIMPPRSEPAPARAARPSAPYAFPVRPGAKDWWLGDGKTFPHFLPGTPHPYLVTRRDVLSRAQCAWLIDCFERCREKYATRDPNEYWDGRYIWQNALPAESEIDAIRIMQQARYLTQAALTQFFVPGEPLYSDTAQLVRWEPGVALPPHADNIHPHGGPNDTPHRSFSSIIYLNDDYEGGETFFPGLGFRLKVEAGALIAFGAGHNYVHGVTPVTKGLRYTYAGWFTHSKANEDANAMLVF
jgi:predicted 2-oxoglutarate/Fe(II)-dependent dioxygenase YbiX